jgi:hypothetical protein
MHSTTAFEKLHTRCSLTVSPRAYVGWFVVYALWREGTIGAKHSLATKRARYKHNSAFDDSSQKLSLIIYFATRLSCSVRGMFDPSDANHRAKEVAVNNNKSHSTTAFEISA